MAWNGQKEGREKRTAEKGSKNAEKGSKKKGMLQHPQKIVETALLQKQ